MVVLRHSLFTGIFILMVKTYNNTGKLRGNSSFCNNEWKHWLLAMFWIWGNRAGTRGGNSNFLDLLERTCVGLSKPLLPASLDLDLPHPVPCTHAIKCRRSTRFSVLLASLSSAVLHPHRGRHYVLPVTRSSVSSLRYVNTIYFILPRQLSWTPLLFFRDRVLSQFPL